MLDPRIYRAAFVPLLFAVVLAAFSLREQPPAVTTTLAPDAFDAGGAYRTMTGLAATYPERRAGSSADRAIAARVAAALRANHFSVSTRSIRGQTADGSRKLE